MNLNLSRKRVLAEGDYHCGHVVGLTPTKWDVTSPLEYLAKAAKMRSLIYEFRQEMLSKIGPIDLLIVNGDCVDGRGEKSGGTELLTTDRHVQTKMARDIILEVGAEHVVGTFGTAYHTGTAEDWEAVLAGMVKADKWGSVDTVGVNGTIVNYRHHIGGSQTPVGRHTPLSREQVWNSLWAERGEYPKADIILRSHVHYHSFAGGPGWLAMTLPAWQGYGSKFGARRMSGLVDIGATVFEFTSDGGYTWKTHILRLPMTPPLELWKLGEEEPSSTSQEEKLQPSARSSNQFVPALSRLDSWLKRLVETEVQQSSGLEVSDSTS